MSQRMRFNKNRRGRRDPRRNDRRRNQAVPLGGGNVRIPRNEPLPTTMTAWLNYDDTSIVRTNVGSAFVGWRYRMNSAFDPDPLLLTGALPGFNEYATLFLAYRVIDFKWSVALSSDELFPMSTYVVPLNTDPGANPVNGYTLAANPKGKPKPLSSIGGPPTRFSGSVNIANFFGIRGYNFDDDYNASVTANPSVLLYLLAGAVAPAPLTASGIVITVRLSYRVVFNRRRNLAA
jgi:hypothetical protein